MIKKTLILLLLVHTGLFYASNSPEQRLEITLEQSINSCYNATNKVDTIPLHVHRLCDAISRNLDEEDRETFERVFYQDDTITRNLISCCPCFKEMILKDQFDCLVKKAKQVLAEKKIQ